MSHRKRHNSEVFRNISQSQSDDDLHLHSNSNINDCNLLLDNKKHPDTSIFDDSSIATNIRRWSLNISRNGKARKPFYHFMPSKLHKTVSLGEGNLLSESDQIEQITHEIEQHDHLMEPNYKSEQLRIDTIKSMPQSLAAKRMIRARLLRSINRRSHLSSNSSAMRNCKFFPVIFLKKAQSWYRQAFQNCDIWYGSMKEIEGRFGSKIGVYFKILRFLVMLNFFVAVFTFSFITFPQILYNSFQAEAANSVTANQNDDQSLPSFAFVDLLTADGYFRKSILFYGGYTNDTINIGGLGNYSLPYAYFLTMTILYNILFVVISISLLRSYRASFIDNAVDNSPNMYCHKIFCAWDFGLSHEKAAERKHRNIFRELKDLLLSEHKKIEDERLSRMQRFWNVTIQVIAHIFVLAIIFLIGLVLWEMFTIYEVDLGKQSQWKFLYIPVVVNSAILFCSIVFTWISKAEEYKFPRTTIHIRLLRNFLLEITIVSALLMLFITRNSKLSCWETTIGQEAYRILIIDFFIHTFGTCCYYFVRYLIHKSDPDEYDLPEFDITHSSLGLVFNQFILWVGLPFSPFLSILSVVKFVAMFYIMKFTIIKCCKAPVRLWKSKQIQTFFLVGIFTTLVGVFVTIGLVITKIPVSKNCGPFIEYEDMSEIFMKSILNLQKDNVFWTIFSSLTKPAIVGGILLTMGVIVYYLRAKAHGQIAKVKLLKEMLYLEAKDKEFLLGNISRLAQGKELSFNLHDEEDRVSEEPEMPIDGFADRDWKYENNLARNLRLDFEHIPTTSGYTRFCDEENLRNRLSRY